MAVQTCSSTSFIALDISSMFLYSSQLLAEALLVLSATALAAFGSFEFTVSQLLIIWGHLNN